MSTGNHLRQQHVEGGLCGGGNSAHDFPMQRLALQPRILRALAIWETNRADQQQQRQHVAHAAMLSGASVAAAAAEAATT